MTSMLVLLFLYLGYIALAAAERESGGEGRITAHLRPGRRGQPADHPLFGALVEHAPPGPEHQLRRGLDDRRPMLWPLPLPRSASPLLFGAIVLMRMRAELARTEGRGAAEEDGGRMNPWPFVIGAYALIVAGARVGLTGRGRSLAMRRAEAEADALKRAPCVKPKNQRLILLLARRRARARRGAARHVGAEGPGRLFLRARRRRRAAGRRRTGRCGSAAWCGRARSGAMPTASPSTSSSATTRRDNAGRLPRHHAGPVPEDSGVVAEGRLPAERPVRRRRDPRQA